MEKQTDLTLAMSIAEEIKTTLLPQYPAKSPRQQQHLWKAAGGGTFNNSVTAMALSYIKEGMNREEILDLTKKRLDSTVILTKEKFSIKNKAREDLLYYRKIQKELGHT